MCIQGNNALVYEEFRCYQSIVLMIGNIQMRKPLTQRIASGMFSEHGMLLLIVEIRLWRDTSQIEAAEHSVAEVYCIRRSREKQNGFR